VPRLRWGRAPARFAIHAGFGDQHARRTDADDDRNQGLVAVAPAGGPSLACGVAGRIARGERGWVIPMLVCGSGITHPPDPRVGVRNVAAARAD
jgi:hypothetical protein